MLVILCRRVQPARHDRRDRQHHAQCRGQDSSPARPHKSVGESGKDGSAKDQRRRRSQDCGDKAPEGLGSDEGNDDGKKSGYQLHQLAG